MSEENKMMVSTEGKKSAYSISLSRPYSFEGTEYRTIDLSGLENLTSEDIFEATRQTLSEYINPRPEADPKYCCVIAALACGRPEQFFFGLPVKDMMKVRNMVQTFFLSED